MAAVDSSGFPTRPAPNELIESAWGVAVRDRLVVHRGQSTFPPLQLANGTNSLLTIPIPVVPFATELAITAHWHGASGTGAADSCSFGGWILFTGGGTTPRMIHSANGGNYQTHSTSWAVGIAAGATANYQIVFESYNGSSPGNGMLVAAETTYVQVVAPGVALTTGGADSVVFLGPSLLEAQ
jgi:hypothetical protein